MINSKQCNAYVHFCLDIYTYASYDIAPELKITLLYTKEMQNPS